MFEKPVTVAAPSRVLASLAASLLGGRVAELDSRSRPDDALLLMVADPVLCSILDDGPIIRTSEWLAEVCGRLNVPVPTGGDFPFSDGVQALSLERNVHLTRFESLHLLVPESEWLERLEDREGFERRLHSAEFELRRLRRLYKDPAIRTLFWPIHRALLRRKWTNEPRAHLAGNELVVFHHVPKCAGMSVFHHLNDHLKWNDELVHLDGRADVGVAAHGLMPFAWKDPRERDRAEVLFGHDVSVPRLRALSNRDLLLVTCLREPAARLVSHYNWEMHQHPDAIEDFESWLGKQGRNWMTRWLAARCFGWDVRGESDESLLQRINAELENFWIVCTVENLDAGMSRLTTKLGLPAIQRASNRAGETYRQFQTLTPRLSEQIRAANPCDVALYERWRTGEDS